LFPPQSFSTQQLDADGNIRFFGIPKDGPTEKMMQDIIKNPLGGGAGGDGAKFSALPFVTTTKIFFVQLPSSEKK